MGTVKEEQAEGTVCDTLRLRRHSTSKMRGRQGTERSRAHSGDKDMGLDEATLAVSTEEKKSPRLRGMRRWTLQGRPRGGHCYFMQHLRSSQPSTLKTDHTRPF